MRKSGSAPLRGATVHPAQNPYSPYIGFHADEDNGVDNVGLLTEIFARCHVTPASMNGAMALWRHLTPSNFTEMMPQREAAAALGCEDPTIIMVPFTASTPGTNDPGQNEAALDTLDTQMALYGDNDEDPIFGFGNLNVDNWMVGEPDQDVRIAAWFALEAQAIARIQAAGFRWCATDDMGIATLCSRIVERKAAWAGEGIDPTLCEFLCAHGYTVSGFTPVHWLLAEQSLARVGVATQIRMSELAFGFLGEGFTDADKPWLLTEYLPGNTDCPPGVGGSECPPHSVRWMRYYFQWCRATGHVMLPFDWTMFVRMMLGSPALTTWGIEFTQDQDGQPVFDGSTVGDLWFASPDAQNMAYNLAYNNQVDSHEVEDPIAEAAGQAAYDHVAAGGQNLFTLPA